MMLPALLLATAVPAADGALFAECHGPHRHRLDRALRLPGEGLDPRGERERRRPPRRRRRRDLDNLPRELGPPRPAARRARPRNGLFRNDGGWRFTECDRVVRTRRRRVGERRRRGRSRQRWLARTSSRELGPNVLYRNRGDGRFERMAGTGCEDPLWTISSAWPTSTSTAGSTSFAANYVAFEFDPRKKRGAPECVYKGFPVFCGPGD